MILHAEITRTENIVTKDGGKLFKLALIDKSKPIPFRTGGEFEMWLSEDKRKELPSGELGDTLVTIAANEMSAGRNGAIKLRGQIITGHVPIEKFTNSALPTAPDKKEAKS